MRLKNDFEIFKKGVLLLIPFAIFSCVSEGKTEVEKKPKVQQDVIQKNSKEIIAPIIAWNEEFISMDNDSMSPYYDNREVFIEKFTSYNLLGDDTLEVSTLFKVNGCGDHIPLVEIRGDSIQLSIKHSGPICMHEEYKRYTYQIVLEDIGKYFIIY